MGDLQDHSEFEAREARSLEAVFEAEEYCAGRRFMALSFEGRPYYVRPGAVDCVYQPGPPEYAESSHVRVILRSGAEFPVDEGVATVREWAERGGG